MYARSDYHVARRLFHVGCGLAAALIYRTPAHASIVLQITAWVLLGMAAAEVLRFWFPAVNRWALKTFQALVRREERRKIHAAFYYAFALGITVGRVTKRRRRD